MNPKQSSEFKNLLIAMALSLLIIVYWQYFIETPRKQAEAVAIKAKTQNELQLKQEEEKEAEVAPKSREGWLASNSQQRVRIASDSLHGSIALKGLRFDDLTLARYHETLEPGSPEVVLLSPTGSSTSYFTEFGWTPGGAVATPDDQTVWNADATELTPDRPVTLTWKNPAGVTFTVKVALDPQYMFTVTQSVADAAGKPLSLASYASINRLYDLKLHPSINILHEGPVGVLGGLLKETSYKTLVNEKKPAAGSGFEADEPFEGQTGDWLGITDKYWLAALAPTAPAFDAEYVYHSKTEGRDHFEVDYRAPAAEVSTVHFFAGAKQLDVLDSYATRYNITLFKRAVDFGAFFYWLTEPIFRTLNYFFKLTGNFGIAILMLTLIVKALMFPLANKSFKAMNRMKDLTPKMNDIRERFKDDKMKMNQEIMELYKREKVNPASGCLPMFIQIPVFFSLYKALYVTIEMRHAPFFGWIHDLSAPDPTNLFTLFGLIHWTPPLFLHVGVWPIIMCLTMVIQQHQSPPPPDPVQAKLMKLLPFFFLYLFSSFAAGLVIYWCWSNTLTILQQWYIKHSHATSTANAGSAKSAKRKR